jgi:hypothetical protein
MTRTLASGSGTTWTLSLWCKRSLLGSVQGVFGAGTTGAVAEIYFDANDRLRVAATNSSGPVILDRVTNRVFRDPSAFMHIVIVLNNSSSCQIWINGIEETSFSANVSPSAGTALPIGSGVEHQLGRVRYYGGAWTSPLSGYLSEIYFVDGNAYGPTDFGQTDSNTGQWIPKSYSGSYGTNGFYLKFEDASNTTAATMGKDSSSNGNNWTPTNFATHDQVLDSPTCNFCTLNPLYKRSVGFSWSAPALANGNISTTSACLAVGAMALPAGLKTYFEVNVTVSGNSTIGVIADDALWASATTTSAFIFYTAAGTSSLEGGLPGESPNVIQTGLQQIYANDVLGVAVDLNANTMQFYYNGSTVGPSISLPSGKTWYPVTTPTSSGASALTFSFGQGGQTGLTYYSAAGGRFAHAPPSGFKALCSANLPAPAIKKPSLHFNAVTYTGNDSVRTISGVGHQPDLIWIKNRSAAMKNVLQDSNRGWLATTKLASDLTDQENSSFTNPTYGYINQTSSDGFSIATTGTYEQTNRLNDNYVAWCWKGGGAPSTNNSGSITSSVSVNTTAGFSVVSYTGTGAMATVGHGLGSTPSFVIVKGRSFGGGDWVVYHIADNASPATGGMLLETTNAFVPSTGAAGYWGGTAPTSSVFTIGANGSTNSNAATHIAYLWAEVAGFSKFGSYTGNNSSDGPFVYCGFKPRFILIKSATTTYRWYLLDSARDPLNTGTPSILSADINYNEATYTSPSAYAVDFLSNGFKLRGADVGTNASGPSYIFAAFAEAPFKYATAR